LNTKDVIHPYTDSLKAKVKVYSLEETMAEKLRSLFQRTRPRDLYDVWYLWNKIDKSIVLDVFKQKCKFKRVNLDINELKGRKNVFKNTRDFFGRGDEGICYYTFNGNRQ